MCKKILYAVALLATSALANAAPLPPPGYNPDVGASLYAHTGGALAIELVDGGQSTPPPGGWTFGFYFASDPGTLITIFEPNDDSQANALIDFDNGNVIDVEDNIVQNMFATSNDAIGFFITIDVGTFFTQSSLNPNSVDPGFSFQLIADPFTHLVGFDFGSFGISLNLINGIRPIPEPGVVALLGIGLIAIGLGRRRR